MCYLCKVEPSLIGKLTAADNKYTEWLHELGFSGLTVLKAPDDYARAKFEDWNKFQLIQNFGFPRTAEGHIAFDVEDGKGLWVSEAESIVLIKKVAVSTAVKNPLNKVDERPITKDADRKVGADPEMEAAYLEAQATPGNQSKIDFMKRAWSYYNRKHFANELKPCKFVVGKNMGVGFRNRGLWRPSQRDLQISQRVFNAPFDVFTEVFVHEMCHQAVTDIDRADFAPDNISEKGHGTNWKVWMRRCGLNPERYDKTDAVKYMTTQEQQKKMQQRTAVNKETADRTRKPISHDRTRPDWASYLVSRDGEIQMIDGALVYQRGKSVPVFVVYDPHKGISYYQVTLKHLKSFLYHRKTQPSPEEKKLVEEFTQRHQ